ncbi:hypothetical protein GAY31_24005 [Azospirillum brasilense]|nr:hypothetical protein [Azospirillum brasilense]
MRGRCGQGGPAGPTSATTGKPWSDATKAELERIQAMDADTLRAEIAAGRLRRPLFSSAG